MFIAALIALNIWAVVQGFKLWKCGNLMGLVHLLVGVLALLLIAIMLLED